MKQTLSRLPVLFWQKRWLRHLLLLLTGATAALAQAPYHAWIFAPLSFPVLYWAVRSAPSACKAAAAAFSWSFGYYTLGLYWIAYALTVDGAGQFLWLIPFCVLGLPLILSLLYALPLGWLARRWLPERDGPAACIAFAALWVVLDVIREHLFTGFPWLMPGTIANASLITLQSAAIGGVFLQTFLVILCSLLIAKSLRSGWQRQAALMLATLLALWAGFGYARLLAPRHQVLDVTLRLVQPNIPQSLKWDTAVRQKHIERTRMLTASRPVENIDLVVWPETAIPSIIDRSSDFTTLAQDILPPDGFLLTGVIRADYAGEERKLYNSALLLDAKGNQLNAYDKSHLVPFGEYVPLRWLLPIDKITPGSQDFSSGDPHALQQAGNIPPWRTLICYEVIFPSEIATRDRPGLLMNLTNDAWYGDSPGPYQHLEQARLRAVEQGLPLARAANNGISTLTDAYGREQFRIPLNTAAIADGKLPIALPPTLFALTGKWQPVLWLAVLLALLLRGRPRQP